MNTTPAATARYALPFASASTFSFIRGQAEKQASKERGEARPAATEETATANAKLSHKMQSLFSQKERKLAHEDAQSSGKTAKTGNTKGAI